MSEPRERGMIFSGPSILAIEAGQKSQTRRVMKPQPALEQPPGEDLCDWSWNWREKTWLNSVGDPMTLADALPRAPYGRIGDILYVKETWAPLDKWLDGYDRDDPYTAAYKADQTARYYHGAAVDTYGLNWDKIKWKPSIFMPKWCARLWLEITEVRVERVRDISESDAEAEGMRGQRCDCAGAEYGACSDCMNTGWCPPPSYEFYQTWEELNAKRGFSWESNPFVFVYSFKRIDRKAEAA